MIQTNGSVLDVFDGPIHMVVGPLFSSDSKAHDAHCWGLLDRNLNILVSQSYMALLLDYYILTFYNPALSL